jgi:hypothetical protein
MNTLHNPKTIQVNLQDQNNLCYQVEILPAKTAPFQLRVSNQELKRKQSTLRWKLEGEDPEFDAENSLAEVMPLVELLAHQCGKKGLPLFISIPYRHEFGGMWDTFTCTKPVIEKTPEWFEIFNKYLLGGRYRHVEINGQEEGGTIEQKSNDA